MTQEAQVTCVNKMPRNDAHDRIKFIGGTAGGGWKLDQPTAIFHIKSGAWRFYTVDRYGVRIYLIVAKSRWGHEYIKTQSDGEQPDNLLSLPECP